MADDGSSADRRPTHIFELLVDFLIVSKRVFPFLRSDNVSIIRVTLMVAIIETIIERLLTNYFDGLLRDFSGM
jgi:hypothetical protein